MNKDESRNIREKVLTWAVGVLLVIVAIFVAAWFCGYPPRGVTDSTSSAIAAWATSIGTFLLAFFAYHAWTTSQGTLKTMKDQAVEVREEQRHMVQVQALATYIDALSSLSRLQTKLAEEFVARPTGVAVTAMSIPSIPYQVFASDLIRAVQVTGTVWRMQHMHNPTNEREFYEIRSLEAILRRAYQWQMKPRVWTHRQRIKQLELNREMCTDLVGLSQRWQMNVEQRDSMSTTIRTRRIKFLRESPCHPENIPDPEESD